MKRTKRVFIYFTFWILLALAFTVLNILNIDWTQTHVAHGIVLIIILGVLQGSVMEFPVQTILTLVVGGEKRQSVKVPDDSLTIVLNYNLLAVGRDDIDECIQTMYEAYMGNLSERTSAVLVSATNSDELRKYELEVRDKYRALIYDELFREGLNFAHNEPVSPLHLQRVWSKYQGMDINIFLQQYLDQICNRFSREFMVIHRVSRVLRKCGQYQDLMLLSDGDDEAYTYTDPEYYGRQARPYGQPLFYDSEDVENIFGRKYDYTLVLDGDTGVPEGSVFGLLEIAAAHPNRGIIQPSIELVADSSDSMFMHLERMRQAIYEPMTNAVMSFLGQSSYFGKAMIKNSIYIENVIGFRQNVVERVPIDVLSHDTFEAALLQPLYVSSIQLLEAPCYNYVSWNIRERRWNRGEVLLALYFWKNIIGRPMRWLQKKVQGDKFNPTKLRTESQLDFVTSYIAHSALRQMFMKPTLLVYIIINYSAQLRYKYASLIIIMFLVVVFPKFATCTRKNYKYVLFETVASILQFTPEAMVGCVRIVRAIHANISASVKWIPQRAVEEDFKKSNPFVSSLKHLWGYSVFSVICAFIVGFFVPDGYLILFMLITLFFLPLYTGFTSLTTDLKSSRSLSEQYRQNLETGISIISQPNTKSSEKTAFTNLALAFTPGTVDPFRTDRQHATAPVMSEVY